MPRISAICISERRGTPKKQIGRAVLAEDYGIEGDAHAGRWHRQVSLLSEEKISEFRERGAAVEDGSFGENLVVHGLDVAALPVGTRLQSGDAVLEIMQIGKECTSRCAIFDAMGDCIMPREGVFARVEKGGQISAGDRLEVISIPAEAPFRAAVVTLSDRASAGERADASGPRITERLVQAGFTVSAEILLPDDEDALYETLCRLADLRTADLVLTTGSTGFAPRDIAPEATARAADRDAPGIADAIRAYSMQFTPHAMLSRARSVLRGNTLIINLPGSPKACDESLDLVLPVLPHGLALLRGEKMDCART